ncbi:MAG: TlpA family protein disulfide reductase [Acidimicrobiia bacterium]|nr:TlpA family protein disulfide reductase [Acidimicrobiia bacterium]
MLALVAAGCGEATTGATTGNAAPVATAPTTAAPTTAAPTTTTTTLVEFDEGVAVEGNALPRFGDAPDPAVGLVAPTVDGISFDGSGVRIEPTGKFTVIMFLAHWCPHCNDEVEALGPYFEATAVPDGVEVLTVSTSANPERPNYPPSEWLSPDTWPLPVLIDNAETAVAAAYGLNAFPFWVVLDPDGVVLGRTAGSLPLVTVEGLFDNLAELAGQS